MKKRRKSLKEILDGLVEKERQENAEEAHLIKKILDKKPELRNTTARLLKLSRASQGGLAAPTPKDTRS